MLHSEPGHRALVASVDRRGLGLQSLGVAFLRANMQNSQVSVSIEMDAHISTRLTL